MTERGRDEDVHKPAQRLNWTIIALIAGLIVLIGIIAYFATRRSSEQDKLSDSQISQAQPQDNSKSCATKATYDLIKAELFRRAAQLRGSDQAAYDQLAPIAVLRMDNPVMESEDGNTGAVNCSGSLSLDLPPGVAVVGGRRTLMADIDYTVEAGGGVELRNADAVIAPLATLAKVAPPAPEATAPVESNEAAPVEANGVAAETPPAPVPPHPPSASVHPAAARPSFDCAKARGKSEVAVCADAGLAALDRNMAAQYARSVAAATPEQRDMLKQTRDRFLRYRDRCANNACIGDAYVGRMREIRDIMEGHYQPPR